jgi:hypothetical protein
VASSLPVYSVNLVRAHLPANTSVDHPIETNFVIVVRDIRTYCDATGVSGVSELFVKEKNSGVAFHYHAFSPFEKGVDEWTGRQVIEPGEILELTASVSAMDVTVSGYLLNNVPLG